MPIESFPLVTRREHSNVFDYVHEYKEAINDILSKGRYVGYLALDVGIAAHSSYEDTQETGYVFLIDVPEPGESDPSADR